MKFRFEKLTTGLRTDFFGTLGRVFVYFVKVLVSLFNEVVYYVYRALLFLPSVITRSKLKHALNPVVKLDYPHREILIHADSSLNIYRAQACQKEPETIEWIEKNFEPGDVFFDVGANVGAYSLVAAKYLDNQAKIYAFEPSYSTYYQLCKNVILNNCQDTIFPYLLALTEQTGLLTFQYSSLEGGSADHFSNPTSSSDESQITSVYKQKIFGFSLDTLVQEYDFPYPHHIKLDVDGAEFHALKGANKTLKDGHVKTILVEVRTIDGEETKVVEYLASLGYELASRHDRGNGIIWNDIFTNAKNN